MTETLATIERQAIEAALDRHDGYSDVVDRAAADLGVSRSLIYRRLHAWRTLDGVRLPAEARSVGVTADEVACIFGRLTQRELAERAGFSPATASGRVREALRLLGRRKTRRGLALLPSSVLRCRHHETP